MTQSGTSIVTCSSDLRLFYPLLLEGAWVLDKTSLLSRSDWYILTLCSPLPEPSLPPGHREPALPDDHDVPVELVALDLYASYWRSVGARVGRRRASQIVWETGDSEPILEPSPSGAGGDSPHSHRPALVPLRAPRSTS